MGIAWETRQEQFDFRTLRTTWRGEEVLISSIRFYYYNFPSRNTKYQARAEAWSVASGPILRLVNDHGAQGWELISPLDLSVARVAEREGRQLLTVLVYVLAFSVIGLPLALFLIFMVPTDYLALEGATLAFRRRR